MIMTRLRNETRTRHDAIEARLGLFDGKLTPQSYNILLLQMWGFYKPIEARIAGVANWTTLGFDFERRRKTALLERDLAQSGLGKESDTWISCNELPNLSNVFEALGCLYVLEGATLGGQIIVRHLQSLPGPLPHSFFTSYGDKVGPMWKTFGVFLTNHATEHGGDEVIVQSACSTFDTLGTWLATWEKLT